MRHLNYYTKATDHRCLWFLDFRVVYQAIKTCDLLLSSMSVVKETPETAI